MNEKKEYQSMLKLSGGIGKIETTANKLGQLRIDAEDPRRKDAATKLADWLRSVPAHGQTKKVRLLDMAENLASGSNEVLKRHGTAILELEIFCQKIIASMRPQWQELALAYGWTPPSPK